MVIPLEIYGDVGPGSTGDGEWKEVSCWGLDCAQTEQSRNKGPNVCCQSWPPELTFHHEEGVGHIRMAKQARGVAQIQDPGEQVVRNIQYVRWAGQGRRCMGVQYLFLDVNQRDTQTGNRWENEVWWVRGVRKFKLA